MFLMFFFFDSNGLKSYDVAVAINCIVRARFPLFVPQHEPTAREVIVIMITLYNVHLGRVGGWSATNSERRREIIKKKHCTRLMNK